MNVMLKPVRPNLDEPQAIGQGLSDEEVTIRRKKEGFNELQEEKRKGAGAVFIDQFKDFLVIILNIAAVISAFLGEVESSIVILTVVLLNAALGTVQHVKAEKSLSSLKALAAPTATVWRNGQVVQVPSREVVTGDTLVINAGDYICADARILESHSLQVNESSLTGESLPAEKNEKFISADDIALGDRKDMVFSGSFVTGGRGKAVVTAIGMDTEIGKIADLLEHAKEKSTPLQERLDQFGKVLAIGITVICLIVFGLDVVRGRELTDSFMFAVSLAVAAIPEALGSIVTIVLAFGTQKMAKENAIIRKLHAVETLGNISVICSDKTGTLTQNKMTVQKFYADGKVFGHDQLQPGNQHHEKLLRMGLLCNDAMTAGGQEIGDPTEIALVNIGKQYGLDELAERERNQRIGEIPFDSRRKFMSTIHRIGHKQVMITKGAMDVLIPRISSIETASGIRTLTLQQIESIRQAGHAFADGGLRVLALAYKEIVPTIPGMAQEEGLTFLGLIAMMDPPREETEQAVADCVRAGIRPVMITGDHKITAIAIAGQIGILTDPSEAVEGKDIEKLADEELRNRIEQFSVYARVSPEHKIRIVRAWQEKGNVVAMTGDGVNDAPALKQADIGVAMGMAGTEVAKDASSMVLTDDHFSTIVKAVSNGRSMYHNIKNAIQFLLSGNAGAIFVVIYASLLALPVPFLPAHLLFINLLTDSLPAIAIGLEPHSKKVMKEKPRDKDEGLFSKRDIGQITLEGLLIAAVTIIAFRYGLSAENPAVATTMAFATLCLARLLHGFNCRSKESIFRIGLFSNIACWIAFLIGVILLNLVLTFGLFNAAALDKEQLSIIYGLAFVPFVIIQTGKLIFVKS
ncbi:cation-translocating P-type ATPase [Bhargavaea beijingensis]|uniref:Cation-translocating P-type ATPase n=1 Tax=Bhargavaea beijingensis TaxID=426756 RepID=A0ABX9ZAQ5_9BACL|nr:cation-translocating P-type ATPase [Bhargavaea beijingensis]RSK25422.1 cation-translocating P-type ATPase [Bhargavaea beijingensis]